MRYIKCIIVIMIIMIIIFSYCTVTFSEEQSEDTEVIVSVQDIAEYEYRMLNTGSRGDDVLRLQERLIVLGYDPGSPDGDYGSATKKAVKCFQRMNNLDDDGIAGEKTQKILYSDEAVSMPDKPDPVDVLSGELPYLVNKENPVSELFSPKDLVLLTDYFNSTAVKIKYKNTMGVREAVVALFTMLSEAQNNGIKKWQISAGYRTWNDQESLMNKKISSYRSSHSGWSLAKAKAAASKTVAEPGMSEHHLGLSFDVNVPGTSSFKGTKQYKWLHAHCWEYGFIIRYPEGKEAVTGYTAEAWHIRYVGLEHSLKIRDNDLCLEEYLEIMENNKNKPPYEE